MIAAMFAFATLDTFVKLASDTISPPQVMLFLTLGSAIIFTSIALIQRTFTWTPELIAPVMLLRYAAEIAGLFGMILALANTPLSTVGAIIQTVPLLVTLGAVLFLNERVSWRRWTAIIIGFLGVLLIIQPGTESFTPFIFWSIVAVIGLSVRDLTTRITPSNISSANLAAYTMFATLPVSLAWNLLSDTPILLEQSTDWFLMILMSTFGGLGYMLLIASVRMAEISIVSPYRYSRLLFMMVFGIFIFGEKPNTLELVGSVLVVASGIYVMWRERKIRA